MWQGTSHKLISFLLPSDSERERTQQGLWVHPVQQRGGAADRHDQHERHVRPGGEAHHYFRSVESDSITMLVVESIVDIIYFIDIIFNFHTSIVSNTGEVITNEQKIRR